MTTFQLGFRTKLDPNKAQANYFARACGVARFSYNWALEQWQKQYQAHKKDPSLPKPNEAALRRQINSIKKTEFPWMLEVTKCAVQYGIKNLGKSFQNFFKNPKHFSYPQFKKKFQHDSFTLSNDDFKVEDSRIRIPRIGWVRMHEALRFENAKLLFATISRVADDWYISFQLELQDLKHLTPAKNHGRVGVDLGVKQMVTLSDGHVFEAPKPLGKYLQKLKRLQRKMSRTKAKGSNRAKLGKVIARLHRRIADIRNDALHKVTNFIASNYSTVVIEDLNVKGMLKNHKLARCIADVGFGEFRQQLSYKMQLRGGELIVADRWYPSSKTCRFCHRKNEDLTLSDREWVCPHCGSKIEDRDLNAALNLCEYRESWGSDDAWASKDPSESSPDLAPPVVVCRQDELVGGIDSLRNNASTDEGASMLKGHPEVNASVDWGRKPTIEPSKLQLGRNSWVFSNGEFSEKRRIEY